jgi:hypothetical protein
MISALIALLGAVLIVGLIAWFVIYIIDQIPMDPPFKNIARVIVLVIALLVILMKALPLLGVSI